MKKLVLALCLTTAFSLPVNAAEMIATQNHTCSDLKLRIAEDGILRVRYWGFFKKTIFSERPECPYYMSPVRQRVPVKGGFCEAGWVCKGNDTFLSVRF